MATARLLVWSQVRVGAKRVDELLSEEQKKEIEKDTIEVGCKIAVCKGSTEFGIGMAASEIVQAICKNEFKVLMCSVDPKGHYGQEGFLSVFLALCQVKMLSHFQK